jgi:hypothetical protein
MAWGSLAPATGVGVMTRIARASRCSVITSLGVLLGSKTFPATAAGYWALVGWVGMFGVLRRAGVEGTGSYSAALARHLRATGVEEIETNQPDKATRRQRARPHPRRRVRRPGGAGRQGHGQREGR